MQETIQLNCMMSKSKKQIMEIGAIFPVLNPNGWQQQRQKCQHQLANCRPSNQLKHSTSALSLSQKSLSCGSTSSSGNNCRIWLNQVRNNSESIISSSAKNNNNTNHMGAPIPLASGLNKYNYQLTSHKFHQAAIDGYVDILCLATKRETNLISQDQAGLTPTLLAASSGQLDALRILVGRGGDPERTSSQGSSAIHLAAARNHLNCVSFLVNFGVNMWSLDNELHTAKDVAAIGQQKEVLDYLDQMMAKQSAINTKQVQKLKEKAKSAAEKRIKAMRKEQMKAIKQVEKDERLLAKLSNNRQLLKAAHSISDIKLVGRPLDVVVQNSKLTNTPTKIDHSKSSRLIKEAETRNGNKQFEGQKCKSSLNLTSLSSASTAKSSIRHHIGSTKTSTTSFCHSSDLESAYSSSVSSNSGYLSSSSAQSFIRAMIGSKISTNFGANHPNLSPLPLQSTDSVQETNNNNNNNRPKYSDLVAINQSVESTMQSFKSTPNLNSSKTSDDTSCPAGSRLSNNNNNNICSTVTSQPSRLCSKSSGVTRKVHLKRLLFLQNNKNSNQRRQQQHLDAKQQVCSYQQKLTDEFSGREKFCNKSGDDNDLGAIRRARSEPDFMSLDNKEPQINNQDSAGEESTCDRKGKMSNLGCPSAALLPPLPPPPPPPPPITNLSKSSRLSHDNHSSSKNNDSNNNDSCLSDQHHHQKRQQLLTRCLSQLKLQQHESIKPSRLAALGKQVKFDQSDELIQHQLNASEFPLKPSIIKQKQQQQQQQHFRSNHIHHSDTNNKSTTIISIDSIGSAGSLIERLNSSASSSASNGACSSSSQLVATNTGLCLEMAQDYDIHQMSNSPEVDGVESNSTATEPKPAMTVVEFLTKNGLNDLLPIMASERIDLEALLLLTESDLKSIDILLGPRRKLLNAIEQYKQLQQKPINSSKQHKQESETSKDPVKHFVINTGF